MARITPFNKPKSHFKARGIIYHCEKCGVTATSDFIAGLVSLPLEQKDIQEQNELKAALKVNDKYYHQTKDCICGTCLKSLPNFKRIKKASEIFKRKSNIIDALEDKLGIYIDTIGIPISLIIKSKFDKIDAVHVSDELKSLLELKKSIMDDISKDKNIILNLHKAQDVFEKCKKKFESINIKAKEIFNYENDNYEYVVYDCSPDMTINLSDYIEKTGDDRIYEYLEMNNPDNFYIIKYCNITGKEFPEFNFDIHACANAIFTQMLKEF